MSCESCPGKDFLCVNCPHWIGHKKIREEHLEKITQEWVKKLGDIINKAVEEACKKKNKQGEPK